MEIREIDPADEALVHRHWEIGRDAEAASRPYDFYPPWETAWLTYQGGREDVRFVMLGAFDGDAMVGAGRTDLNLLDNLHSAYSSIHVDPAHQRRGFGRALDAACVESGPRQRPAAADDRGLRAPRDVLRRACCSPSRWATSRASRTA